MPRQSEDAGSASAAPFVPVNPDYQLSTIYHQLTINHQLIMLMQIPTPAPGQLENWLVPAAAVASMALLFRKLFPRKRSDDAFVTRSELYHELNAIRDKIDARFLALSEKIETLGSAIHDKLTQIESAVARLDERTKH